MFAMSYLYFKIFCYYFCTCCYFSSFPSFVFGDFGRLDIRVGKILEVTCHPQYPRLALIRTDLAASSPKVILSDLYSYKVPLGHLRNKKTIFLMNVVEQQHYNISYAPGEFSDAKLLMAYDGENADILEVPSKSFQGDIVEVEGYNYQPERGLKLRDFEKIGADLRIDSMNVATYKDKPLKIRTEGAVTTKTLFDCVITTI